LGRLCGINGDNHQGGAENYHKETQKRDDSLLNALETEDLDDGKDTDEDADDDGDGKDPQ